MINHFLLPLLNTQIQETDYQLPIPIPIIDPQFSPRSNLHPNLDALRQILLGYPKDKTRLFLQGQYLLKIIHAIPEADEYIRNTDNRITYLEDLSKPLPFGVTFTNNLINKFIFDNYDLSSDKYISYLTINIKRDGNQIIINNQKPISINWTNNWSQWIPIHPNLQIKIALHESFDGTGSLTLLLKPKIQIANILEDIYQNIHFFIYEQIKTQLPATFKQWLNTPCDDLRQLAAYILGYGLLFYNQ